MNKRTLNLATSIVALYLMLKAEIKMGLVEEYIQ